MSYDAYIKQWCGSDSMKGSPPSLVELKYLKNILEIATEEFYYSGLPNELTSQILELTLFFRFNTCFYKDEAMDEVVLCTYVPNGKWSKYLKPQKVNLLYLNGIQFRNNIDYADIIPIRDNIMDIPLVIPVMEYIKQLVIADKTFDINMINLRLPFFFSGDKKQQATLNALYQEIADFKPIVFTSMNKNMLDNLINTIDTNKFIKPMEVYDVIKELKNQVLQSIGIYSDVGKKERLLVSEVSMQNDYVDMIYQARLRNRTEAINECNRRYGTKIKVMQLYTDIKDTEIEEEAEKQKILQGNLGDKDV